MMALLVALLMLSPVRVTVYHAVEAQTDSNPTETADGTVFKPDEVSDRRIAAVSQDLLARNGGPFEWGDYIFVSVPDMELKGWWRVHDTMAKELCDKDGNCAPIENHVDLLVPEGKLGVWHDVSAYHHKGEDYDGLQNGRYEGVVGRRLDGTKGLRE